MKYIILNTSLLLSTVLALSFLAKADFDTAAFAQGMMPKMRLEEGIKALKAGDNQVTLMHLGAADQALGSSRL
jgi:hypothetical protein